MHHRVEGFGGDALRAHERYLLSLASVYAGTNFVFSFYSGMRFDLYISVFIVEYFILTLLNPQLDPKIQRSTNWISYVLFALFTVIVTTKFLEIVGASLI
jgi:hypothetical protein